MLTPAQEAYVKELPATASEIARKLNKKQPNVYHSLQLLVDKGLVTVDDSKIYHWNPAVKKNDIPKDLVVTSLQQDTIPKWVEHIKKDLSKKNFTMGSKDQVVEWLTYYYGDQFLKVAFYLIAFYEEDYYDDDNPQFPEVPKKNQPKLDYSETPTKPYKGQYSRGWKDGRNQIWHTKTKEEITEEVYNELPDGPDKLHVTKESNIKEAPVYLRTDFDTQVMDGGNIYTHKDNPSLILTQEEFDTIE